MQLQFKDYQDLVVAALEQKKNEGSLPNLLIKPSPGNLRKACLNVYIERSKNGKEELNILEPFFGVPAGRANYSVHIERFSTDKFRPLQSFILGEVENPSIVIVDLLAWLIDFPHRPFRNGMNVILNDTEKEILEDRPRNEIGDITPSITEEQGPAIPSGQSGDKTITDDKKRSGREKVSQKKKKWLIVGIALFFAILTIGFYQIYNKDGNCMYWTGDHYERIDCDAEGKDKIDYNAERLKTFQKILNKDTISEKSIGVVHYFGNKNREFFTCGGKHPVENTRYVKPMTPYIWEKEFARKDSVAKDTSADQSKKLLATNPKK